MSEVLEVSREGITKIDDDMLQVINDHDHDKDGKLNMEEYRDFLEEEEEEEREAREDKE